MPIPPFPAVYTANAEVLAIKLAEVRERDAITDATAALGYHLFGPLENLAAERQQDLAFLEYAEVIVDRFKDRVHSCTYNIVSEQTLKWALADAARMAGEPDRPFDEQTDARIMADQDDFEEAIVRQVYLRTLVDLVPLGRRSTTYLQLALIRDVGYGWRGLLAQGYGVSNATITNDSDRYDAIQDQMLGSLQAQTRETLDQEPALQDFLDPLKAHIGQRLGTQAYQDSPQLRDELLSDALQILNDQRPPGGYKSQQFPKFAGQLDRLANLIANPENQRLATQAGVAVIAAAEVGQEFQLLNLAAWLQHVPECHNGEASVDVTLECVRDLRTNAVDAETENVPDQPAPNLARPDRMDHAFLFDRVQQAVGQREPEGTVLSSLWRGDSRAEQLQALEGGLNSTPALLAQNRPELLQQVASFLVDWKDKEDRTSHPAEQLFKSVLPTTADLDQGIEAVGKFLKNPNEAPTQWDEIPDDSRQPILVAILLAIFPILHKAVRQEYQALAERRKAAANQAALIDD